MRLLEELLTPPEAPPLLLLATAREGFEPRHLPCPTTTIDLGPLDATALVTSPSGSCSESAVAIA